MSSGIDWLRLIRSQNVGPRTFRALINHFGGARAALEALPGLARRGGGSGRAADLFARNRPSAKSKPRASSACAFVAIGETDYPRRLQMIDDPPPLVAVRGHAAALAMPQVAIVGSRNASAAGVKITQRLAHGLCEAGFAIVSGLARGIDAAAHRASLTTGTVAVLAGGHDRVYPPEHVDLLDDIVLSGAALTEMPLGWEPRGARFPAPQSADFRTVARRRHRRGRQALGLADHRAACARTGPRGVRGARLAARSARRGHQRPDQAGRDAGDRSRRHRRRAAADHGDGAAGPRAGARGRRSRAKRASRQPDERARIVALLSPTPVSIDDLIRLSQSSPRVVRMVLLELEIAGRLERHGGGLVSLM